jgi:hypothetical protein
VTLSEPITAISGVVEKSFFVDVDSNGVAYPDGSGCYNGSSDGTDTFSVSQSATSSYDKHVIDYNAFMNEFKHFDINSIKRKFDNEIAAINAEFHQLIADANARYTQARNNFDNFRRSCTGINFFTQCLPALGNTIYSSLDVAMDELKNLVDMAAADVAKLTNEAANAVKDLWGFLQHKLVGMFNRAEKLMKYSAQLSVSDMTGRCVDSRIQMNYNIGKLMGNLANGSLAKQALKATFGQIPGAGPAIDDICSVIDFFGQKYLNGVVKCVVTGKINMNLGAFTDECYWIVAVDSATGTIASPGKGLRTHADDWMDKSEYKRLCSNLPTPMIHGWAAPLHNQLWCLPEKPPASWADGNIGILEPIETAYRVNRSWSNYADGYNDFYEDQPTFPTVVMSQTPSESMPRDSAKNWYYQLVYSKEDFNLDNLFNDAVLLQYFSFSTISQMRTEYCSDSFFGNEQRGIDADLTGATINPKCWGYLTFAISGYNFMPMSILSNTVTP